MTKLCVARAWGQVACERHPRPSANNGKNPVMAGAAIKANQLETHAATAAVRICSEGGWPWNIVLGQQFDVCVPELY